MKQHVYKITSATGGEVRLIAAPNRARAIAHAAATAFTAQRADALDVSELIAQGVAVERIPEPVNGTPVLANPTPQRDPEPLPESQQQQGAA